MTNYAIDLSLYFESSLKCEELISLSLEKQKYKEFKVASVTDRYVNDIFTLKKHTLILGLFHALL